jgi:hypothetical protein
MEMQLGDALEADGYVDASAVRVQIGDSGEVTLTGTVPTEDQRRQAEKTAASVQGIASVKNRLEVESDSAATDDGGSGFGRDKESAQRPVTTIGVQPKPKS